ncbi:hypothetical protein K505DRAFT_372183 [Melanomma pulvis-pyrius CBS 109.77]|uniref:Tat pathway signal sequence n=1 Tax=Melanomma pulvis-pyrius CBS 109.77 TaxID=1314802 RepID=A0A6A6XPA7_9PLEO|nr:hypothetical protein K505DRAFT_372183 [Melanomma pulvis-pyrius CBS 109.77]
MEKGDHEEEPFLQHSNAPKNKYQRVFGRKLFTPVLFVLLSLTCIFSNMAWWMAYEEVANRPCTRPRLIFSPATEAIKYERRKLWRSIELENPYAGDPRVDPTPLHDAKWSELVRPMAMKITAEELSKIGEPSIAFKDGSGYLTEMAVFHELHCIKRMRRHFHLKFYYGNATEDEDFMNREWQHMDHCLEYWREAAMCRGDPTLTTFVWNEGRPFSKVHSTHECVNWDQLYTFAESRMVDVSDYGIFSELSGHDEGY